MRLLGPAALLALHGADVEPGGAGPVVALGDPAGDPPDVVWRATPGDAASGVRTIAPGGEGLWRRAPLPAADALFALPPGPAGGVLVAGGDEAGRAAAVAALADAGVTARATALPTAGDLAGAGVVVVPGPPGEPLAALALPVLAAGRLLVAPRAEPAFGLAAGVDHLAHDGPEEMARLAAAAVRHPGAFAPVAVLGRLAAEAHRASVVLGRLAADLAGAASRPGPS